MAVRDVTVVSVPASDQERAKEFYVGKLGFELVREDDSVPGIRWVQVAPKGGATSLTLVTWTGAIVKAVKTADPAAKGLPVVQPAASAGCC
jgi:catechol 2,3-dioxygenase-like lactoylglutathione lyase family enzyme